MMDTWEETDYREVALDFIRRFIIGKPVRELDERELDIIMQLQDGVSLESIGLEMSDDGGDFGIDFYSLMGWILDEGKGPGFQWSVSARGEEIVTANIGLFEESVKRETNAVDAMALALGRTYVRWRGLEFLRGLE